VSQIVKIAPSNEANNFLRSMIDGDGEAIVTDSIISIDTIADRTSNGTGLYINDIQGQVINLVGKISKIVCVLQEVAGTQNNARQRGGVWLRNGTGQPTLVQLASNDALVQTETPLPYEFTFSPPVEVNGEVFVGSIQTTTPTVVPFITNGIVGTDIAPGHRFFWDDDQSGGTLFEYASNEACIKITLVVDEEAIKLNG
jgi:hypothetical protein